VFWSAPQARDRIVNRALRRAGWRVLRIWEHELQKAKKRSTPHLASGHPLPDRGGEGEARLVRRILEKLKVDQSSLRFDPARG